MPVPLSLRIKAAAGRYLPFLKMGPPPDRDLVFRLRPVRNSEIEWKTNEAGEAILTVPRRRDRMARVISFWFKVPETRGVELDEVGTFVWSLCDGENTVESIVRKTSDQYRMNRREVEVSVTTFLQMLAERRFVGWYQRGGKRK